VEKVDESNIEFLLGSRGFARLSGTLNGTENTISSHLFQFKEFATLFGELKSLK
jgi:hypothetical protein